MYDVCNQLVKLSIIYNPYYCFKQKKLRRRNNLWLMQLFITLSCLIAVSVNFSTFLVIGTTSPVTYQVLGHLKTCLILSFGYVLLRDPFTAVTYSAYSLPSLEWGFTRITLCKRAATRNWSRKIASTAAVTPSLLVRYGSSFCNWLLINSYGTELRI
jgi:hypothetical protein